MPDGSHRTIMMNPTRTAGNKVISNLTSELERRNYRVVPMNIRTALVHPDALIIHWPESPLAHRNTVRATIELAIYCLILIKVSLSSKPIVWVVHNLARHEGSRRRRSRLLFSLTRRLATRIVHQCDASAEIFGADRRNARINHPSYERLMEGLPQSSARDHLALPKDRTVLLFIGFIRPYKGVEDLIETFKTLPDETVQLVIAGQPFDAALGERLRDLAGSDHRIRVDLGLLSDEDVERYIIAADAVLLPYQKVLNSGVAIHALSLGRPIVAKNEGVILDLHREFGPQWVRTFDRSIGPEHLAAAPRAQPAGRPDMKAYEIETIGAQYQDVIERSA